MNIIYRFSKKKKHANTKFHENTFCGSRDFQCGRKDGRTNGPTDITKLTVAFGNFTNSPNDRFCVFRAGGKVIFVICPH